jgi:hypothetical protein
MTSGDVSRCGIDHARLGTARDLRLYLDDLTAPTIV